VYGAQRISDVLPDNCGRGATRDQEHCRGATSKSGFSTIHAFSCAHLYHFVTRFRDRESFVEYWNGTVSLNENLTAGMYVNLNGPVQYYPSVVAVL
jgi:hypothetical protein